MAPIGIRRPPSSGRGRLGLMALALPILAACQGDVEEVRSSATAGASMTARAEIRGCGEAEISGVAVFRERPSAEGIKLVDVSLEVRGLADGVHAVHVHETAACEPCGAAGGHHDPGPFGKTTPDVPDYNHPFHAGDLVNLEVNDGVGTLTTTTSRFSLSPGRLSVFDDDGSAVIIHTNADTYCDPLLEPGCAGGARDACGVLELAE